MSKHVRLSRIRSFYVNATEWDFRQNDDRERDLIRKRNADEFDSWLAEHDRKVRAEVVRLHEQLAALADELDASGERRRFDASPYEQAAGVAQVVDAARIRAALEGAEE